MLTSNEILKRIKSGGIKIDPFNENNLGPNSYDLTLSNRFLWYPTTIEFDLKKHNSPFKGTIPDNGIVLKPGELYLGCTNEYTESLDCIPLIEGRSSLARLGISIHQTGGFGDIGFCGNWTLEITVIKPVRIYHSVKFAQICWFESIGKIDKRYQGKYQESKSNMAIKSRMHYEF